MASDVENYLDTVTVLSDGDFGDELHMLRARVLRKEIWFDHDVSVPCQGWKKERYTLFLSPAKARELADLLNKKADEAEKNNS